jgi:acyl-homoserine-lactone acylase
MSAQRSIALRRLACPAALCLMAALAGCRGDEREITVQRTSYGVAHIQARDLEDLAYGFAYAHAQDNVCQTLEFLVTVRGLRSKHFGPEAKGYFGLRDFENHQIDTFVRFVMRDTVMEDLGKRHPLTQDAQALRRGYVAGFNRYVDDATGKERRGRDRTTGVMKLPQECRDRRWRRLVPNGELQMHDRDFDRMTESTAMLLGAAFFLDEIVGAAPPPAPATPGPHRPEAGIERCLKPPEPAQPPKTAQVESPLDAGSNGWAFGATRTPTGSGVLVANPHFPWRGPLRMWQVHLTVKGGLDAMGATMGHVPMIQIGFNRQVAWTHTASAGKRSTLFALEYVPGATPKYRVDGKDEEFEPVKVEFETTAADGTRNTVKRTLYETRYGPVLNGTRLPWSTHCVYALKDANRGNARTLDTLLAIGRAADVKAVGDALRNLGIQWANTLAADAAGRVLYADHSVTPDIDRRDPARCPFVRHVTVFRLMPNDWLPLLNGSDSTCDWQRTVRHGSPLAGLVSPKHLPRVEHDTYVLNANDSFWWTSTELQRLQTWHEFVRDASAAGIETAVIGEIGPAAGHLRTYAAQREVDDRFAGADGLPGQQMGTAEAMAMILRNRNLAAALVLDDVLAICAAETGDRRDACDILAAWDRRNDVDSRGALLFRYLWNMAASLPRSAPVAGRAAPFDRGLDRNDTATRQAVLGGLDAAILELKKAHLLMDASPGDVQAMPAPHGRIALHGGTEREGVLNKFNFPRGAKLIEGLVPELGTSYLQVVGFQDDKPVADALLVYGQSSHRASPHATDQLPLFAAKQWVRLPFTPAQIAADPAYSEIRLERK